MNIRLFVMLCCVLALAEVATAQTHLMLVHRKHPKRTKILKLDRGYDIVTRDTTLLFKEIIAFTDSTLTVVVPRYTGRDTTMSHTFTYPNPPRDTVFTYTSRIYAHDTVAIAFSDIRKLKRDWFKNTRWLEGFAWLSTGVVLAVPLLPVAMIDKGKEGLREWLVFEGILIGICAPPIFIGTRKRHYNLTKRWMLKVG